MVSIANLIFLLPYLLSSAISAGVGVYCWRRREVIGARAYGLVALSQAASTLGLVLELLSPSLAGKIFWDNVQFLCWAGWFLGFLLFTVSYSGRYPPRPPLFYSLVALPIILMLLLIFTDTWHGLIRANAELIAGEPFDLLLYDFGASIWLFSAYCCLVYLAGIALLASSPARWHPLYRIQIGLLLFANLVPLIGTSITLTLLADLPYRDLSPFTFALSNLLVAAALFRFRLFDIVPVARDLVVEHIGDAVLVFDAENRLVDLNPAARMMLKGRSGLLIGQALSPASGPWQEVIARYPPADTPVADELEITTDGGGRSFEVRIEPIRNRHGRYRGRVMLLRDISRRKQIERELQRYREQLEQLVDARTAQLIDANERLRQEIARRERLEARMVQVQKLEAIGRLAGGVAHDFNNTLTVIGGCTEFLLERSGDDPQMRADLQTIAQATRQATALTRQLLAFGRKQDLQLSKIDLNHFLAELRVMLERLAGRRIRLQLNLQSSLALVLADAGQLQQVILNLVINACDAMPEGGTLTIETTDLELEPLAEGPVIGLAPGAYVVLAVKDTGIGMSQEVKEHLFEPFFTTKEPGKGTGLGLATVHGIVKQSGGEIDVESEPGHGAIFRIYLPSAAVPAAMLEHAGQG